MDKKNQVILWLGIVALLIVLLIAAIVFWPQTPIAELQRMSL